MKHTRKGNFFSLPNEVFLLGLSPGELAVYSYLRRCENRKTHLSVATVPNEPHPNPDAAHSVGNASPCTTSKFASQNKEGKPVRN